MPDRVVPNGFADGDDRIGPPARQGVEETLDGAHVGLAFGHEVAAREHHRCAGEGPNQGGDHIGVEQPAIDDVVVAAAQLGPQPSHVQHPPQEMQAALSPSPPEHTDSGPGRLERGGGRSGLGQKHHLDLEPVPGQPLDQGKHSTLRAARVQRPGDVRHPERPARAHRRIPLDSAISS